MKELAAALEVAKAFGGPSMGELLNQHAQVINGLTDTVSQQNATIHAPQEEIQVLTAAQHTGLFLPIFVVTILGLLAIVWMSRLEKRIKALESFRIPSLAAK